MRIKPVEIWACGKPLTGIMLVAPRRRQAWIVAKLHANQYEKAETAGEFVRIAT
jgi:hypothetical protein